MTGAAAAKRDAPPATVIFHDLDQARRVLAAARRTGRPVQLHSAPGAGAYLGPALFKQITDKARAAEPGAAATFCLDCGDETGTAMDALRHGVEVLSLSAAPDVLAKVENAAAQAGTRLTERPARALDMQALNVADADRRLDAWLKGDSRHD